MQPEQELDLQTQQHLVDALRRSDIVSGAPEDVQYLQTHISHVILAGQYAYKIKKPLNLGFLDFSTLARRRHCCEEELRLNRRLAPDLYLEVVPITGTPDAPGLGGEGAVLEYAVKMRRFAQSDLLSVTPPDRPTLERLAEQVAEFHLKIPAADPATTFGTPERVLHPMLENFAQIREIGLETLELPRLDPLEQWTREQARQLHELLWRRKREGQIRECHGDMHLGNIASYQGRLQIFDGIEFNPNLSWIDTLNDVGFLLMDLQHRGLDQQAADFLDRYLQHTGDYPGLPLLRFYQTYRAMVRAKVAAIRLNQEGLSGQEYRELTQEYLSYIELAEGYIHTLQPALLITHGLSGSGKSLFSGWLLERLPAVRLRSDVERRRLFGQGGGAAGLERGIYTPQASEATYEHLRAWAGLLLQAGYSVIVDATFLKAAQREPFQRLAEQLAVDYVILDCQAPEAVLRERIDRRLAQGADPSEADPAVLELQMRNRETLSDRERAHRIVIDTQVFPPVDLLDQVRRYLSEE
jgi:aminoglycoside phosphotransferase family enzyme/predicted kinase